MNDKELADAAVELGVGSECEGFYSHIGSGFLPEKIQRTPAWFDHNNQSADLFVRNWQVAGALMEKCLEDCKQDYDINVERDITNGRYLVSIRGYTVDATNYSDNDNCSRAIIEACVSALTTGVQDT